MSWSRRFGCRPIVLGRAITSCTLTNIRNPNPRILNNYSQQLSKPFSSPSTARAGTCFFSLSSVKGEISRRSFDGAALVNATSLDMLGGGKIGKAIRRVAGSDLQVACSDVSEVRPGIQCPIGEARISRTFKLPISHVMHPAVPICESVYGPNNLLRRSYRFPSSAATYTALSTFREFHNDFKKSNRDGECDNKAFELENQKAASEKGYNINSSPRQSTDKDCNIEGGFTASANCHETEVARRMRWLFFRMFRVTFILVLKIFISMFRQ